MPNPTPGIHLAVSRSRLGQINDPTRNGILVEALRELLSGRPNCLCLGELSLLPLMAARLGSRVAAAERNPQMRLVLESLAGGNGLDLTLLEGDVDDEDAAGLPFEVGAVAGEPNFSLCLLPWHNLRFWFLLDLLRRRGRVPADVKVSPVGAELWAAPVEFRDLWKIRAPLGTVEGFSVADFDRVVLSACDGADAAVEPHPLWEYPCAAAGSPRRLMSFDFREPVPDAPLRDSVSLGAGGRRVNGVALWMVWRLDEERELCTGPVADVAVGERIEWDLHSKQGVHIFVEDTKEKKDLSCQEVVANVTFDPKEAELDFSFERK